jgi:hypothetical protein
MKIKLSRIFSSVIAIALAGSVFLPASAATSLYADLSASPNTGQAPLNNVSLTASVSGDATGLITYRFDCTSDGVWDWIQTTSANPYTATSICNYPTAGNYTATTKVERENLAFQGTVAILALTQANLPTVDLKANGMDGSISINYNTAATLSWTSSNANSCYASGDWSGSKYVSGFESTGNLTSSKNYTITCTGSGGSVSDSVGVSVSSLPQTLYVGLEAIPNSGTAPLNGVDLRATVTGTAYGTINYKFDCISDGIWDQTFYGISENPKTVVDACNYQYQGSYVAKVRVERGTANPAEATAVVVVGSSTQDVNIIKLARNLSDNTGFAETVAADPGEVIEFRILVISPLGSQSNLTVKDTLPDRMSYYGGLKIDDVNVSGNVLTGLDIGSLNLQQTRTVVFQAVVANASNFSYGITELINTALVYNTSIARTDTAKVQVTKTEVKGATDVPTGMLDSAKISFIVSGLATLLLTYFLLLRFYLGNRAYAWGVNNAFESAKEKIARFLPKEPARKKEERLARIIEEIRKREKTS